MMNTPVTESAGCKLKADLFNSLYSLCIISAVWLPSQPISLELRDGAHGHAACILQFASLTEADSFCRHLALIKHYRAQATDMLINRALQR